MAGANVQTFSEDNWQTEVVQSDRPVLVDFWAPWCGPCRALAPTIDRIADQFAGRVKVGKLNVDDNPELASKYSISGIPAVLLFQGGEQPRDRIVGLQSEATFVQKLNGILGA